MDFNNLIVRLRATAARLRRSQKTPQSPDRLQVDTLAYTVKVGNETFSLSPMQSHLLHALWCQRGVVVHYGVLESLLWGNAGISSRQALKQLMRRLRRHIGEAGSAIRSVPGVGYLLE